MADPKEVREGQIFLAILLAVIVLLIALGVKVCSLYDERYQAYLLVSKEVQAKWGGQGVMSYSNEEATRVTKDPGPPIKYLVRVYLINSDGSTRMCGGSVVKDSATGKLKLELASC